MEKMEKERKSSLLLKLTRHFKKSGIGFVRIDNQSRTNKHSIRTTSKKDLCS